MYTFLVRGYTHLRPVDGDRHPDRKLPCFFQAGPTFPYTGKLCLVPLHEIRAADTLVPLHFPLTSLSYTPFSE